MKIFKANNKLIFILFRNMSVMKVNKVIFSSIAITTILFIFNIDKNVELRKLYTYNDIENICKDYNYSHIFLNFNKSDFPNYNTTHSDMLIKYTKSRDVKDLTDYALQRYLPFIIILGIMVFALFSNYL